MIINNDSIRNQNPMESSKHTQKIVNFYKNFLHIFMHRIQGRKKKNTKKTYIF